jgi:C4-dicarboxylate-specific signal transduction histidine kinase
MNMDSKSTERMQRVLRHRLLNIASGIKAAAVFLESQQNDTFSAREREYFPLIRAECDGICSIVGQLDQMFGPNRDLTMEPLREAVSVALSVVREELPTAEVICEADREADSLSVCGAVVVTAFREAVRNAWQASSRTVLVTVCTQDQEILFRIIDQGAGFSEEGQRLAFEPFYTTKPRSLGLGLSIVRRQVADLGGSVSLGREARGNYVQFNLPYLA